MFSLVFGWFLSDYFNLFFCLVDRVNRCHTPVVIFLIQFILGVSCALRWGLSLHLKIHAQMLCYHYFFWKGSIVWLCFSRFFWIFCFRTLLNEWPIETNVFLPNYWYSVFIKYAVQKLLAMSHCGTGCLCGMYESWHVGRSYITW